MVPQECSDASVIGIGPLFLMLVSVISECFNWYSDKCTNNVISCDNIKFFYATRNYGENAHFHWKNQKPEVRQSIGLVLVIGRVIVSFLEYQ